MLRSRVIRATVRPWTSLVLGAFMATLAALALASPAMATEHHPKGVYAPFADCPLSNSRTEFCVFAKTESGEVITGKKTVPITNAITLQGGFHQVLNAEEEIERLEFIGAEDGNTLSKSPQVVPGGLFGVVCEFLPKGSKARKTCEEDFSKGLSEIKATTELAAPATSIGISVENLLEAEGTALSLPVKLHLENVFLGTKCYIGSNEHPITINLTTGTSGKFTGKVGTVELLENGALIRVHENSLVNNTFPAPASEGCGGSLESVVKPILDEELGIPDGEGANAAVLNGTLETANAAAVKASE
jgi:hypothetical protein